MLATYLSKVIIKCVGMDLLLINNSWLRRECFLLQENTQLWCLNRKDHNVRTWAGVSAILLALPSGLPVSCHSFQHLTSILPHSKSREQVSGSKKRLPSSYDLSDQKRISFQEPTLKRLSFIGQNKWDETTLDQSLGLQKNYHKRLKLILIPALSVFLLTQYLNKIMVLKHGKSKQGQGWLPR